MAKTLSFPKMDLKKNKTLHGSSDTNSMAVGKLPEEQFKEQTPTTRVPPTHQPAGFISVSKTARRLQPRPLKRQHQFHNREGKITSFNLLRSQILAKCLPSFSGLKPAVDEKVRQNLGKVIAEISLPRLPGAKKVLLALIPALL